MVRKKTLSSSAIPWLESQGIEYSEAISGGGHLRLEILYNGQKRIQFESFSTSDGGRAQKNNIANAKRLLREMGWKG